MVFCRKIFVPAVFNDFGIFLYDGVDKRKLMFFESVVIDEFYGSHVVFGLVASPHNMYMLGFMFVLVEHEPELENDKECRHLCFP